MSGFKQYRRKQIAELREYKPDEVLSDRISVSASDREAGSPKPGDMIARNPKNHEDQWLVAAEYFADNFEPAESYKSETTGPGAVSARPAIAHALADLKETWAFTTEELTHIAEHLNGVYNDGGSSERQPLNLTVGEQIAHAQRLCARMTDLSDFSVLQAMLVPIVPVEHCADGLLTLRFRDGTRLAFQCGPSGRLNGVIVQHGPSTPELRLPDEHGGST